ncbi:hypothetical protein [Bradyrhizobium cajani]|uniref:Sel1 repeat family protein n=1 Tax=Bradyrhizobium cajani TaxID=1928661 RepID=A0A844T7B3_9BRAD|nr:hypothetical protein [Bradyrhizobium cajani]MCP3369525.1 hypothetical protein [Bradyrhizobium cajani]MVT71934.1 hypothetical protein [Bradyrhizobium cajani]
MQAIFPAKHWAVAMGVHGFDLSKAKAVALASARRPQHPQFSSRGRGSLDIARRPRACAIAGGFIVVLVTCLFPLLIGAADAKSPDQDDGGGARFIAMARLDRGNSIAGREQTSGRLILAQRADKAQPAEAQSVHRPAAPAPQGAVPTREQQRAPADSPALETTASSPAGSRAVQAAFEAERVSLRLLLDQERDRREKLARELAAVRAELDATRQIQTHTGRAIEIGIQQTQALEHEREKTSNLSRELSFLRAELEVARVAASKAMQASEAELKQERPLDRRNGAKRFALQLASLGSELDAARSEAAEAKKSAAAQAVQTETLERELKQEQDKAETLINELGPLRIAVSETAKLNAADTGQKQALTRELEKQRDRAESAVRQLDSVQAQLRAAQTASSELAAHRAADAEHKRALEREIEQQRSRADALARETAAAAAKAQARLEREQADSGEARPPAPESARYQLSAWNAFAVVEAPWYDGGGRATSQGVVQPTASPPTKPPASGVTPPDAQLTTGAALSGPDAKVERPAASAPPRPLANEERLLARASALLRQADINGARGLLEYILDHGSAQAAFMLAETYDPHVLRSWDARGVAGDRAKARELYERARAGGIHNADGRIRGLR